MQTFNRQFRNPQWQAIAKVIMCVSVLLISLAVDIDPTFAGDQQLSIDDLERYGIQLINFSRSKKSGLKQLEADQKLTRLARRIRGIYAR